MTIAELKKGYKEGRFSVRQVVESCLDRIYRLDNGIGAFITVCEETALVHAEQLDQRLNRGEDIGPLGGIPVAIKDNICTKNIRTTCASKMLEDFVPHYDARVIGLLKKAGAVIIGKTNMDEFAMGAASITSAFKRVSNPWDLSKVAGGSSGGSAAAVAAGFAPLALGSDTGGSVRQPASFCGVVGLKPTYNAVSRYGLIAFAPSFDCVGLITRTVKDCELAFQVVKEQGSNSLIIENDSDNNCTDAIDRIMHGFKIGIPEQCLAKVDEEIAQTYMKAEKIYRDLGTQVEWFSFPEVDYCAPVYSVLSSAEAASSLGRYDGIRYGYCKGNMQHAGFNELIRSNRTEGFGEEVKRRILFGSLIKMPEYSSFYEKAVNIRKHIRYRINMLFKRYNLILMPTSPVLPFDINGEINTLHSKSMPDRFTALMNLAGIPAISLPGGFSQAGLPVGIQLAGNNFSEASLFRAAYCLEQALGVCREAPVLEGNQS